MMVSFSLVDYGGDVFVAPIRTATLRLQFNQQTTFSILLLLLLSVANGLQASDISSNTADSLKVLGTPIVPFAHTELTIDRLRQYEEINFGTVTTSDTNSTMVSNKTPITDATDVKGFHFRFRKHRISTQGFVTDFLNE